ncbi:MAG TPA: hypothetical protein VM432_02865, partial [Bdellovibrionales bacterium]|nr:hypothetical protein [Bdellovibrionales bacterium]
SFHRALDRNLDARYPKPRIVVTRPGVPIPKYDRSSNVRVIENMVSTPISATRILQSLAMGEETADLDPKVAEYLLSLRRYRYLLQSHERSAESIASALSGGSDYSGKTFFWDPRENSPGLWQESYPMFSAKHRYAIEDMKKLGAEKVHIVIDDSASSALPSWKNGIRQYFDSSVTVGIDDGSVWDSHKIRVVHSGYANETLKSGDFKSDVQSSAGIVFFETSSQPLSPLLSVHNPTTIKERKRAVRSCTAAINASGF